MCIPYWGRAARNWPSASDRLDGDRFRWKSGGRPCFYGLHLVGDARAAEQVTLVEGESDVRTLWHQGIPVIGLRARETGGKTVDAKCLDEIDTICIVIEPDKGGQSVRNCLRVRDTGARKAVQLPAKDRRRCTSPIPRV